MALFISQNSETFAMNGGAGTGDGSGVIGSGLFGKNWPAIVLKAVVVATLAGIIQIIINPDIIKIIIQFFSKKYAEEMKLEQLRIINESLRTQLEQLRIYCNDKKIVKAMEETYLKSCIQIMELQKNYLEKYAN